MKRKTEISTSGKGFYNTILILFFFSGVSALAYQVIWVKMSGLVFGVAPFAVSTVLSSFMAGLTLGSLYLGRVADKSRNPFKLFGFIEIGIGVFAFLFPFLLSKLMHSYLYLYLHFHANFYLFSLLRFVIIFAFLLVPTFLMGGTLPVLSRVSILDIKMLGRRIGTLYTVNNLGAAVGAFVTGFLLIRLIGLRNGISFAAAINIAIGGVALVLSRFFDGSRSGIATSDTNSRTIGSTSVSEQHNLTPDQSPLLIYILVTIFTISGFASLVYEVVWTRILSASVLSNSVYSFSTVVITFIVGIALGSLIYAMFMERLRDNITLFGFIEAGIGIYALLSLPAFGRLPSIIGWISPALFGTAPSWSMCVASEFIPAFLLMIIPTTLMGMSFPMMSKIYAGSVHKLGSKIGLINGLDTAGPVLGAFAGGFLFIPLLGMQRSVLILSFVNVTMGGIVIFLSPYFRRNVKWGFIALLALIVVAGNALIPSDFNFWRSGRVPGERLVYYNEDAAATVVVREYPQGGRLNRVMEVDGTDVAGTDYMLKTTQKLQGHLPLLIHRDPKHILIVGLGSGGTTYAVSRHHVKRIDVVELVPSVVESATKYFTEVNHGVIHDPRVTIRVDDGRNFVLTARDKYDVILTESIHPIYAGNGNLYSLEYFSLCKQRLADNTSWGFCPCNNT